MSKRMTGQVAAHLRQRLKGLCMRSVVQLLKILTMFLAQSDKRMEEGKNYGKTNL